MFRIKIKLAMTEESCYVEKRTGSGTLYCAMNPTSAKIWKHRAGAEKWLPLVAAAKLGDAEIQVENKAGWERV